MSDLRSIQDPTWNTNYPRGMASAGFESATPSIVLSRNLNRHERLALHEDTSLVYAANKAWQTLDYRLSILEEDVEALLTQMAALEVPDIFAIPPTDRQEIEVTLIDQGFAPFRYIESEEDI